MKRSYMVVFERVAEDNWGAWVPDVAGAVGTGNDRESVRQSVIEGMLILLEDAKERGLSLPEAASMSIDFAEFDPDPSTSHYEIEWLAIDLSRIFAERDEPVHRAA